jgi:hypothetical protein
MHYAGKTLQLPLNSEIAPLLTYCAVTLNLPWNILTYHVPDRVFGRLGFATWVVEGTRWKRLGHLRWNVLTLTISENKKAEGVELVRNRGLSVGRGRRGIRFRGRGAIFLLCQPDSASLTIQMIPENNQAQDAHTLVKAIMVAERDLLTSSRCWMTSASIRLHHRNVL